MIKLVALDLDGTTLLEDHSSISDKTVDAIHRAKDAGAIICIVTGRSYNLTKCARDRLGIVDYAITGNGSAIFDAKTGEMFEIPEFQLSIEQANTIYNIFNKHKLILELYHSGQSYIRRSDLSLFKTSFSPEFERDMRENMVLVDSFDDMINMQGSEKLTATGIPVDEHDNIWRQLVAHNSFSIFSSFADNIEVSSNNSSKGIALSRLCADLSISLKDVIAFGDGDNDISMLKIVGLSYAVENAIDELKQVAKFVTASNEDEGVSKGLSKYF
jgi:Cof subfamily protein (haloacid dehalogenase superfamily)